MQPGERTATAGQLEREMWPARPTAYPALLPHEPVGPELNEDDSAPRARERAAVLDDVLGTVSQVGIGVRSGMVRPRLTACAGHQKGWALRCCGDGFSAVRTNFAIALAMAARTGRYR